MNRWIVWSALALSALFALVVLFSGCPQPTPVSHDGGIEASCPCPSCEPCPAPTPQGDAEPAPKPTTQPEAGPPLPPHAPIGDIYDAACANLDNLGCSEGADPGCAVDFRLAAEDGRFVLTMASAECAAKATSKATARACKGIACR